MITASEAAKKVTKRHLLMEIDSGLDFGNFFVFFLVPFYAKAKKGQTYESGTIFPAIDKKTGKIFKYDITSDPVAFQNAKKITIS